MIKVKDGYAKLVGTTYLGSANHLLRSNGDVWEVHTGRNNEANKIVRTDGSGYLLTGWISTTSGDMGTTSINRVYCSNDSYIRYKTPANFFSSLTNNGDNLSITIASQNRTLTVLYAKIADLLRSKGTIAPQTGRTLNLGDVYSYHLNASVSGGPTTYAAVIGFGRGTSGTVEIAGEWTSGRGLWVRALRDTTDNWYAWDKVLTQATYTGITDSRYYTKTESDNRYVNVTGDIMTGSLRLKTNSLTRNIVYSDSGTDNMIFGDVNGSTGIRGSSIFFQNSIGNSIFQINENVGKFTNTPLVGTNKIWHAGNDGSGSGLDADLLDGTHKSGLFTALTSTSAVNLSATIGGTTLAVADLYATHAQLMATTRYFWGLPYNGTLNVTGSLTGVTTITISNSGNGTSRPTTGLNINGIRGIMAGSDLWAIFGYGTASDGGYMEIATGDNGNEPIYIALYSGGGPYSTASTRTHGITLMNSAGNLVFNTVTGVGYISTIGTGTAPFTVSSTTKVSNLNVDLLDGYHETSFFRARGSLTIASSIPTTTELSSNNNLSGSWTVSYPGASGHLVQFNTGGGSTRYMQFYSHYSGSLYWRNSTDSTLNTKSWKTIVDSANYTGIVLKIGTATVGSTTKPIYLNEGTPTASNATVGAASRPIYMSGGNLVAGTYTFGNASGNAAINNGTVNTNLNADMLDGVHNGSVTAKFLNYSTTYTWDCNAPTATLHRNYGEANTTVSNKPSGWLYGLLLTIGSAGSLNGNLSAQFIWDAQHNTKNPGILWFRTRDSVNGWDKNWGRLAFITDKVSGAQVADKLGTTTVGSATKGIYLNAGSPVAMTYSLAATVNSGATNKLAYYSSATAINDWTTSVGSSTLPIYINAGTLTACSSTLGVSITGSAYDLKIHDIRGTNPAPNASGSNRIRAWFNHTGTPDSAWWSGITVSGWQSANNYAVWLLAGYSSTTSSETNLYYRRGLGSTWGAWLTILTNINYSAILDARYVNVTGDTMSGTLTTHTTGTSAYNLGIRINRTALNQWATLTIGYVGTGTSGTSANTWLIGTPANSNSLVFNLNTANAAVGLCLRGHGNTDMKWNNNTVWHAGNDGSGSGLDADLLDGTHKSGLLTSVTSTSATNLSIVVGGTTKSVVDLYANYAVSAGNADTLDGYHAGDLEAYKLTVIDTSGLNNDTWYPVTMNIGNSQQTRIRIEGHTSANATWNSRTDKSMSLILDYVVNGSSWGWTNVTRTVYDYQEGAGASNCLRGVRQLTNSSTECIFVRGGAKYKFYISRFITPILRTTTYTISSQSVSPTTTMPGAIVRNNLVIGDNASSATKLLTARTIFGKPFNGTANVAGQGLFYGSAVSAGSGYVNGALQIREAGQVGNAQTSDQYAPRIGFHWGSRFGYSLIANSGEFKFQNQAETGYVNIRANGFIKNGSSNAYVLLGGGGHKAVSDFAPSAHTHSYLPLSGGTVTGITNFTNRVRIVGTVATPAWNSVGITFTENTTDAQAVSFIYTSYDTYRAPAGIKLIGSQGNEWFEAPKIYATTFYGSLSGNASTATKLQTARTINGTSFNGSSNIVTSYWGTARTITLSGAVTGSASVNGSLNVTITTTYQTSSLDKRYVGGNKTAKHGSSGTAYTADSYSSTFAKKEFVAFAERGSWNYANNGYVTTNTGVNIPLAGTAVFQWGASDTNKTLLFITPFNNSGVSNPAANEMLFYTSNGSGYTSAWTRVLTHRNYTAYTVTKTGGGASGTWGISITGTAASARKLYKIDGTNRTWSTANSIVGNGLVCYVDTSTSGRWDNYGSIFQFSNIDNPTPGTSGHWLTQMWSGTSNKLGVRWRTNTGNWSAMLTILTNINYSEILDGRYANTLTFSAGKFSSKTYNGSSAITVNIPTHTSHLTNNSGFWTGTRYWANIAVSTSSSTKTSPTFSTAYTSNWFRSTGNTGWYSETYGGGWNMTDTTYIRAYGSKRVYNANTSLYAFYTSGGMTAVKGFWHSAVNSNSYVLLAGGSYKGLEDFAKGNAGSATKGVYVTGGTVTAMTYSLSSNLNSGTSGKLAYYSSATTVAAYTSSVGATNRGVYMNAGVPTVMTYYLNATVNSGTSGNLAYYSTASTIAAYTSTVGSIYLPVYMNSGVPTVITYYLNATVNSGTSDKLAYYSASTTVAAYTSTVGTTNRGVYMNAGVPSVMTYYLNATVYSGTPGRLAYYSSATTLTSYTNTVGSSAQPIYLDAGVPTTIASTCFNYYDRNRYSISITQFGGVVVLSGWIDIWYWSTGSTILSFDTSIPYPLTDVGCEMTKYGADTNRGAVVYIPSGTRTLKVFFSHISDSSIGRRFINLCWMGEIS